MAAVARRPHPRTRLSERPDLRFHMMSSANLVESFETHSEGMSRNYTTLAINIKFYGEPERREELEAMVEALHNEAPGSIYYGSRSKSNEYWEKLSELSWEIAQEQFFEDANWHANEHGFGRCYNTGRSGGWLIVEKQYGGGRKMLTREDLEDSNYYTGETIGWNRELILDYARFREDILNLLGQVPMMLHEIMEDRIINDWPNPLNDAGGLDLLER